MLLQQFGTFLCVLVWLLLCVFTIARFTFCWANHHYSGFCCELSVTVEFLHWHNIQVDKVRILGWITMAYDSEMQTLLTTKGVHCCLDSTYC